MLISLSSALRGAAAGVLGSVAQAAIGKTEELLMLPSWEDSHLAPRLVDRLAEDVGVDLPPAAKWTLGTAFHLGYGAAWGTLYAVLDERTRVPPLIGGALLGGTIYGITFPRWGLAVATDTERSPERRTRRMTVVAVSVAMGFGFATAYGYRAIRDGGRARERIAAGEAPARSAAHRQGTPQRRSR